MRFFLTSFPLIAIGFAITMPHATHSAQLPIDSSYEAGFQLRAEKLLSEIADAYTPPPPIEKHAGGVSDVGKYSFPVAIARFQKYGQIDSQANSYIADYGPNGLGQELFHFPFVGLARILSLYEGAPEVAKNKEYLLNRIINQSDNYQHNAFHSEGTENHVSMSRTSGYIFTQLALALDGFDQAKATPYHKAMEDWLHQWSKLAYEMGAGEWDSGVYFAYNFIGWLNVYDFAENPSVKKMAKAVVDYFATLTALKYTQGVFSGAESRGDPRVGTGPLTATEYFAWLWFGDSSVDISFRGNDYIQTIHGITSSYRPPQLAVDIAQKKVPTPAKYHILKPNYLQTSKGESQENFYITEAFTVGTAQTPYGGWTNASYGVVNWKLVAKNKNGTPHIFWGNGGMKSSSHGRGRNPYDQFYQHENTVFQLTSVPENAQSTESEVADIFKEWQSNYKSDFEMRWGQKHYNSPVKDNAKGDITNAHQSYFYFPPKSYFDHEKSVFFFEHGDAYVVARSLSGSIPTMNSRSLADEAPTGSLAGFVVEAFSKSDFCCLDDFKSSYLCKTSLDLLPHEPLSVQYKNYAGHDIKITYNTSGEWKEMEYDWSYGVTEKRYFFQTQDWVQPEWPTGEGQGRIAKVEINGVPLDSFANPAIVDGPNIHQAKGILTLSITGKGFYRIDYSGDLPIFKSSSKERIVEDLKRAH